jgi:FkbM family methyltransferase
MITVIAEHTVDLSILPEKANVLDLGCRGFLFANDLILKGHNLITVDVDPTVSSSTPKHFNVAIAGENGKCMPKYSKDPQATTILKAKVPLAGHDTPMYTLKSFSEMVGIDFWDLIKIDIEGSEYEVIMSLNEPPAKQLSIEFHLHTGVYGLQQMAEMRDKLTSLGYEPVSHEMTKQHGLGLNFWDSLFILK